MSSKAVASGDALEGGLGRGARGSVPVLVVFEHGRSGEAALRAAAERAEAGDELSVVTLAPQAKPSRCCGGGGAGPYNCAVRDAAAAELAEARELLGALAGRATFRALVGQPEPPLLAWIAEHEFHTVFLPGRPFAFRGGRQARSVRRATAAEVRLVRAEPRWRRSGPQPR